MVLMMKLDDIFLVKNGIATSSLKIEKNFFEGSVPFIRPASTQQRTIAGWIDPSKIKNTNIYPSGTIFVSTNGEGSHTYAYVSSFAFVPNSDVSVLLPKRTMGLQEKIFYAKCITMNRFRFSYGRKPKGDRLKNIQLPTNLPLWIEDVSFTNFETVKNTNFDFKLQSDEWQYIEFQEIFDIKKGKRLTKAQMLPGKTPFVGSSDKNNGITGYVMQQAIHEGNTISVAYNGSVAEAFYQPHDYWASDDINVLYPKFDLNPAIGLFICTVIKAEQYRFSYGRKWHIERMRDSKIKLPITPNKSPDFEFMDSFIRSLAYGDLL